MSRRQKFASLGAITASCLILVGLITSSGAAAANGDITQLQVFGIPADITSGADGNLWFTDYIGNEIVKTDSCGSRDAVPDPDVLQPSVVDYHWIRWKRVVRSR